MENKKRLIDVNYALQQIEVGENENGGQFQTDSSHIKDFLNVLPTVDAVEVVHGRWLDIQFDPMWRSMLATCSHCRGRGGVRVKSNECGFAVPDSDYCPSCGAKMDLED